MPVCNSQLHEGRGYQFPYNRVLQGYTWANASGQWLNTDGTHQKQDGRVQVGPLIGLEKGALPHSPLPSPFPCPVLLPSCSPHRFHPDQEHRVGWVLEEGCAKVCSIDVFWRVQMVFICGSLFVMTCVLFVVQLLFLPS